MVSRNGRLSTRRWRWVSVTCSACCLFCLARHVILDIFSRQQGLFRFGNACTVMFLKTYLRNTLGISKLSWVMLGFGMGLVRLGWVMLGCVVAFVFSKHVRGKIGGVGAALQPGLPSRLPPAMANKRRTMSRRAVDWRLVDEPCMKRTDNGTDSYI